MLMSLVGAIASFASAVAIAVDGNYLAAYWAFLAGIWAACLWLSEQKK